MNKFDNHKLTNEDPAEVLVVLLTQNIKII